MPRTWAWGRRSQVAWALAQALLVKKGASNLHSNFLYSASVTNHVGRFLKNVLIFEKKGECWCFWKRPFIYEQTHSTVASIERTNDCSANVRATIGTVRMVRLKSRTLQLLAFDEKSTFETVQHRPAVLGTSDWTSDTQAYEGSSPYSLNTNLACPYLRQKISRSMSLVLNIILKVSCIERTWRLRPVEGSGDKYLFLSILLNQVHSTHI